jgi:hypothetical protein
MKLPYSTTLTDMAGAQIVKTAEVRSEDGTIKSPAVLLTVKDVLLSVFSANLTNDEKLSEPERYATGKMGFDIGKEREFSIEDVARIKERVGKAAMPMFVYQIFDLLESAAGSEGKA